MKPWTSSRIRISNTQELTNRDVTRLFSGNAIEVIENGQTIESENVECIPNPKCLWKNIINWIIVDDIAEEFQKKYPHLGIQNNPKMNGVNWE